MSVNASHAPNFIERTFRSLQAMRVATLESVQDLLTHSDPCLRAAAAHYLHLLVSSQSPYPPGVVESVRQSLEQCWDQEHDLGVLIALEQCLDG